MCLTRSPASPRAEIEEQLAGDLILTLESLTYITLGLKVPELWLGGHVELPDRCRQSVDSFMLCPVLQSSHHS